MAIFDTMQYVPCDVATVCFGMAASMGAFLLGAGAKGKRRSLPNARIMIHQPLGGAQGQAADVEIQAKEIVDNLALENIQVVPDKEIVALIAYLQRIGTDIGNIESVAKNTK